MNILLRVVALVLMSGSYLSVAYAFDGAGDNYEQEADRVADKRPSPMMQKGKQNSKIQKGLKGKAATSAKRMQNIRMQKGVKGMKGVGKEKSLPAR